MLLLTTITIVDVSENLIKSRKSDCSFHVQLAFFLGKACNTNIKYDLLDNPFYFRDIVLSVFQAHDDFCSKVKTRWLLIFKLNHSS